MSESTAEKKNISIRPAAVILMLLALLVICSGIQAVAFLSKQSTSSSEDEPASAAEALSEESAFKTITGNYKAYLNKTVELTGYISGISDTGSSPMLSLVETKTEVLGYRESEEEDSDQFKQKLSTETSRFIDKTAVAVYALNFQSLQPGDKITVTGTLSIKGGKLEIRDAVLKE